MFTQEMAVDIVEGLRAIFKDNIVQIILYGSVAREEATAESDIDIAVIVEMDQMLDDREAFISWTSGMDMKYDRVFSIIDIERARMEQWGDILPFYRNIKKEGVVLWKAA